MSEHDKPDVSLMPPDERRKHFHSIHAFNLSNAIDQAKAYAREHNVSRFAVNEERVTSVTFENDDDRHTKVDTSTVYRFYPLIRWK